MTIEQPSTEDAPPRLAEQTVKVVWPTIGVHGLGRLVGRAAGCRIGRGFWTLGKPLALSMIPAALVSFGWLFLPFRCRRYRLTNRRIAIDRGLNPSAERSLALDEFDEIAVEVLPGQEFFRAGEIVFRRRGEELLRLSGVGLPEIFRQTCLSVRRSVLAVEQVVHEQYQRS